jgi:hypothetical protein
MLAPILLIFFHLKKIFGTQNYNPDQKRYLSPNKNILSSIKEKGGFCT